MGNKDALFAHLESQFQAVTFDELTIANETPSDLDWNDVDLTSPLSRNIQAPVPILTSPMTTITESEMAIAAAMEGGGGVIHHANTPEEQKAMVRRVKLFLNAVVDEPITLRADQTVESARNEIVNRGFEFRTLPVVDENDRFVGLMTNTHFRLFANGDGQMAVHEAMTPAAEVPTAESELKGSPAAIFERMKQHKIKLLPLITKEGKIDGLCLLDDIERELKGNPRGYNLDANGQLRTFMSVSTYDVDAVARVEASAKYLDMVVVDTSHGESKYSFSTLKALKQARQVVKDLRENFAGLDIMVGNVSDIDSATALAKESPDALRVGRGPGGICISRKKLGGGTPQATAIYQIKRAVNNIDPEIAICADGGIRGPGDFIKALALGADAIMLGGYVAGTDEAAAPVETRADGTQYKEYNGMGSAKEQRRSRAARQRYNVPTEEEDHIRSITQTEDDLFVEGVEKEIPLQGPVARKFRELTRGVRVEMATGGFPKVADLQRDVRFWRVTAAGAQEGQASKD